MPDGYDGTYKPIAYYTPWVLDPDENRLTGQITGTTAGTGQLGPDVEGVNGFLVIGHPDNTDTVWVYGAFQASKSVGWPLPAGSAPVPLSIRNLKDAKFDVDVSGEKICWIRI